MLLKRLRKNHGTRRILALAISLLFLAPAITEGTDEPFDYKAWVQLQNVPVWVREMFAEGEHDKNLEFSYHLNPCYLRGDFNGDGESDIAIMVRSISDGKIGIVVCHYGLQDVHVLGAGSEFGRGGMDFSWSNIWSVYRKGEVPRGVEQETSPTLLGDALELEQSESGGALIYWDGEQYRWYPRGC